MTIETELRQGLDRSLDRSLDHRPAQPATAYLERGRRARRRRRAARGVAAAAVALAVGAPLVVLGQPSPGDGVAVDRSLTEQPGSSARLSELGPDPDYVAPPPANPVEAVDGLAGVESYSTDAIPSWASEHGNHGPVAIAPDGRLWVAPDAVVRRTVVDPLSTGAGALGSDEVTSSYAVEVDFPGVQGLGDVVWVLVYTDGTGPAVGEMDEPGRWTDDFEVWVDDVTAGYQGRPDVAARLVHFADDRSARLAPGDGVQVVRQIEGVDLGRGTVTAERTSIAEVRSAGRTWFVLGEAPRSGSPWFEAYDPEVSATDLDGFRVWLREGGR